jgi:alpha-tubulin suppressor-like RCC1 family protein
MTAASTPVSVWGLTGATAIAAGDRHSCALLSDGTVRCWGYVGAGEIGTATTAPLAVTDL